MLLLCNHTHLGRDYGNSLASWLLYDLLWALIMSPLLLHCNGWDEQSSWRGVCLLHSLMVQSPGRQQWHRSTHLLQRGREKRSNSVSSKGRPGCSTLLSWLITSDLVIGMHEFLMWSNVGSLPVLSALGERL